MRKALFLDRDGTINVDYGYVYLPEKFELIDGVVDLCRKAQECGYLLIVITNQSGIERGYFTEADFEHITAHMCRLFAAQGVHIDDVFHCPSLSGPRRKPECGMFLEARDKYDIDMAQSISLGDKPRDVEAGIRAGCGRNLLFEGSYNPIKKIL